MDIEKLIERLKGKDFERDYDCTPFECGVFGLLEQALTALSTLQAENERLHDLWSDASIRLEDELAENEKLRAELEQVKRERDAAIEYLREIEWCAGCKHFGGLDGCKKWAMGQCTEKHDLYEFIGPQKED